MSKDLVRMFNNSEFGQIRTVEIEGKPYFVGVDVARALDYAKPSQAVIDHCKGIRKLGIPSEGGVQETNVIPTGDVYRLIVKAADQSRNPNIKAKAERFERWIFDEVIPTIQQTGMYAVQPQYKIPQTYAEALRLAADLAEENEKQRLALEAAKPKVEFYDAVAGSKDAISIRDAAKVLGIKGIGQNKLFRILREKRVLMSDNRPYQEYCDRGYFRVIEQKFTAGDETRIYIKTLVYQKGLDFIRRLLTKNNLIELPERGA